MLLDLFSEEVLFILFPNVDVADLRCLFEVCKKVAKFLVVQKS